MIKEMPSLEKYGLKFHFSQGMSSDRTTFFMHINPRDMVSKHNARISEANEFAERFSYSFIERLCAAYPHLGPVTKETLPVRDEKVSGVQLQFHSLEKLAPFEIPKGLAKAMWDVAEEICKDPEMVPPVHVPSGGPMLHTVRAAQKLTGRGMGRGEID